MAKPYYNPAVAGATEDLNILALARLEMIGVEKRKRTGFSAGKDYSGEDYSSSSSIACA